MEPSLPRKCTGSDLFAAPRSPRKALPPLATFQRISCGLLTSPLPACSPIAQERPHPYLVPTAAVGRRPFFTPSSSARVSRAMPPEVLVGVHSTLACMAWPFWREGLPLMVNRVAVPVYSPAARLKVFVSTSR